MNTKSTSTEPAPFKEKELSYVSSSKRTATYAHSLVLYEFSVHLLLLVLFLKVFFSFKNMASNDLVVYGWRSTYGKLATVQAAKFPMVISVVKHC
jgi:hypothetical protein